MLNWTPEANEHLEAYLHKVTVLAQRKGYDSRDIHAKTRTLIERKAQPDSTGTIDLEAVVEVLDRVVGTPENLINAFSPQNIHSVNAGRNSNSMSPVLIVVIVGIGGLFVMSILAAILLPALSRAREAARRSSCANNLKQLWLVMKISANDNDGYFPVLSEEPGRLMFDAESVYPEYLADPSVFVCPSAIMGEVEQSPEGLIDDHVYFYISHTITNEEEGLAYVEAYRNAVANGESLDNDFTLADGTVLPRIRSGLNSTQMGGRSQSEIPVLIERSENHIPSGANVLYMDGHVEFHRAGQSFPLSPEFMQALESIDR